MNSPASSTKIGMFDFRAASKALVLAIRSMLSLCISVVFMLSMAVEMLNSESTARASWNLCTLPVTKNAILPFFNVASSALYFLYLFQHFGSRYFSDTLCVSGHYGSETLSCSPVVRALEGCFHQVKVDAANL